eukprot:TRINITY_DN10201_c0_g2_i1.p1 TRINITY_DN10201_c0_g2~~TRINITY_DN10201_c0_g2_i1.p1  ORF type:complete len:189 (+),score=48.72 TRINITY_DN10201_c0_g2_i1:158-724(+)
MAYSLKIFTDSGISVFSATHQLPPIDSSIISLLQAFYISTKESVGFNPKSLQTRNGNIVFENFAIDNSTYVYILITNQFLANSHLGYGNLIKVLHFLQVALINLTGPQLWTSDDATQTENLKKQLKGSIVATEILKAMQSMSCVSTAVPMWITDTSTKKFIGYAAGMLKAEGIALWFEDALLSSTKAL